MADGLSIQVLIVSWSHQHANAVAIANALQGVAQHVGIVYSDADPALVMQAHAHLIRRLDYLFFGGRMDGSREMNC